MWRTFMLVAGLSLDFVEEALSSVDFLSLPLGLGLGGMVEELELEDRCMV